MDKRKVFPSTLPPPPLRGPDQEDLLFPGDFTAQYSDCSDSLLLTDYNSTSTYKMAPKSINSSDSAISLNSIGVSNSVQLSGQSNHSTMDFDSTSTMNSLNSDCHMNIGSMPILSQSYSEDIDSYSFNNKKSRNNSFSNSADFTNDREFIEGKEVITVYKESPNKVESQFIPILSHPTSSLISNDSLSSNLQASTNPNYVNYTNTNPSYIDGTSRTVNDLGYSVIPNMLDSDFDVSCCQPICSRELDKDERQIHNSDFVSETNSELDKSGLLTPEAFLKLENETQNTKERNVLNLFFKNAASNFTIPQQQRENFNGHSSIQNNTSDVLSNDESPESLISTNATLSSSMKMCSLDNKLVQNNITSRDGSQKQVKVLRTPDSFQVKFANMKRCEIMYANYNEEKDLISQSYFGNELDSCDTDIEVIGKEEVYRRNDLLKSATQHPPQMVEQEKLQPIGVFWDIENCQVPKGLSATHVVQAVRNRYFSGKREAEFLCVCDTSKENPQILEELNDAQVNVIHVGSTVKNAADDKLLQSMRRFADIHGNNASIVLISGDTNFATELYDLRYRKNLRIILVHNAHAQDSLKLSAHETALFSEVTQELPQRSIRPKVNNGISKFNKRPNVNHNNYFKPKYYQSY